MSPSNEGKEIEASITAEIQLYYDLHLPEIQPAPLLIALHGYGASKRQMMREARQMAPANFAIAALQGFHQHLRDPKEPGGPLTVWLWLAYQLPAGRLGRHTSQSRSRLD